MPVVVIVIFCAEEQPIEGEKFMKLARVPRRVAQISAGGLR